MNDPFHLLHQPPSVPPVGRARAGMDVEEGLTDPARPDDGGVESEGSNRLFRYWRDFKAMGEEACAIGIPTPVIPVKGPEGARSLAAEQAVRLSQALSDTALSDSFGALERWEW